MNVLSHHKVILSGLHRHSCFVMCVVSITGLFWFGLVKKQLRHIAKFLDESKRACVTFPSHFPNCAVDTLNF